MLSFLIAPFQDLKDLWMVLCVLQKYVATSEYIDVVVDKHAGDLVDDSNWQARVNDQANWPEAGLFWVR